MKRLSLLAASLLSLSLHADSSSVSSKKASFDGNALILKGAVEVSHSLGRMCADFARLERETKEGPYSSISLEKNVSISLEGQGEINCQTAELNFQTMKGVLLPRNGEFITFKGKGTHPFTLSAPNATLEFAKEGKEVEVSRVIASFPVYVEYGDNFSLSASEATYFTESSDNEEGHGKVLLKGPSGLLRSSPSSLKEGLKFACNELLWNEDTHTVLLKGNVSLTDSGYGQIHCTDQVTIQHELKGTKWNITSIMTDGETSLHYNKEVGREYDIVCSGQVHIDEGRSLISMESRPGNPLTYTMDALRLSSRTAEVHYTQEEGRLSPKKVHLQGDIQLKALGTDTRCALADSFTLLPDQNIAILASSPDQKVLFWDEEKELSISASEVHIIRTESGEEIKGIGSVSFAFSSSENELLKKLFPFYRTKGKAP